ncbi:GH92 family glycosyl hydrolase [Solibaculum mannosilyticum]|uniref:Glycoside hydrolase family 92 protein n=1 Tax=Solibaculum mannosilyticum TaxID=2780922 RepID=A0A7I8D3J1_9FIRM|nr:GH92 family glycosyl hydrolase [Solibaculum mannosilyticum]BCI60069.1 hypothetical protein C12CBH8_07080 [Solibaculum mannosilyticum]
MGIMKKLVAVAMACTMTMSLLPSSIMAVEPEPSKTNYVDYVNPYIGTDHDPEIHNKASNFGGMVPWVSTPFGMTKWTPQTRQNKISGTAYRYCDTEMSGFQATHQPAIWMGDFGYMTMMPGIDSVKTGVDERKLPFTHEDELTTPYYYSVSMDAGEDRSIRTEMTATSRTSILRFTYPENEMANLYTEMSRDNKVGSVTIDPEKGEITGYNTDRQDAHLSEIELPNFRCYYVIQYSKPFAEYGTVLDGELQEGGTTATDKNVGAYVTFDTEENEMIEVRVSSSFISLEQARENLEHEQSIGTSPISFDEMKEETKTTWEDKLNNIEIEGASEEDMTIFYTAMYHALLFPVEFSEYGRYYSAYDDQIHEGESYTSFSLWDTYRAENSFLTLVAPERIDGMISSLLNNYLEGGYMPKWPNPSYTNIMIGTPADSLVAEAINKGFDGFDLDLAYEAVLKDGMVAPKYDNTQRWGDRANGVPYEARAGLSWMMQYGYVPEDKTGASGSNTLEGAYEDWCIAQVAQKLGKQDDYEYFVNRSQNYKNLFNEKTGLLQSRDSYGNFVDKGWTEGSQMNYAYCVFQDFGGLMELMGDGFNDKLDNYFATGQNVHENEPSHHYAYLYDFSGKPWETQRLVREIAEENYANHPAAGLTGNDDCGQMSSWYILSSLGFYPVNPASAQYMIGSPFFDKATIHYEDKDFEIIANNNSKENMYIQSGTLNGEALNIPVLTHEQIINGGTIEFEMGAEPSTWGSDYRVEPLPTYEDVKTPELPIRLESSKLEHQIAEAEILEQDAYTVTSFLKMQDEIVEAKKVYDEETSTKEEIQTAYNELHAAVETLEPSAPCVKISHGDTASSPALNKVYIKGKWNSYANYVQAAPVKDPSPKDYYTIVFEGTQLKLYSALSRNQGMGAISIDGGPEVEVDFYRDGSTGNGAPIGLVYETPILEMGQHTIKVRVAGKATGDAGGSNRKSISFAYAEVYSRTQEETEAFEKLEKAKRALLGLVEQAASVDEKQYTLESIQALKKQIDQANVLLRDQEAVLETIEEKTQLVQEALDGLVQRDSIVTTVLSANGDVVMALADAAGTQLKADVTIVSEEMVSAHVVSALYDASGKMMDCTMSAVEDGITSTLLDIPSDVGGMSYSLFVWKDGEWSPLCEKVELR